MGKKKRLRAARQKKNRTTTLVLDMGRPLALRSAMQSSDGRVTVATAHATAVPARAFVEMTYPRAQTKGDKVVNRIELSPSALSFSPELALSQYEWVLAVDTNRHPSHDRVTFTGVVQAQVREIGPSRFGVAILRDLILELHDVEYSAERFGWWLVLSSIVNRPRGKRIALLVDAYLSDLPLINRRVQPVLGNNFLPEGFELVYASSEKPNDSIANNLLRRADVIARQLADVYDRPDVAKPPTVKTPEGGVLSHIRTWEKHGPAV